MRISLMTIDDENLTFIERRILLIFSKYDRYSRMSFERFICQKKRKKRMMLSLERLNLIEINIVSEQ